MSRTEVVPFRPEFQRQVLDLIVGIQRDEFGLPISAEQQPDLRRIPGFYQVRSENFWVALRGADVVGTIALRDVFLGTTPQFLAAHRFYEKNGFREIGRSALPAAFPIMEVDEKFYHRSLDAGDRPTG